MNVCYLQPSGLCNRLYWILSLKTYFRNQNVLILWFRSKHCNGYFLDYFEPIENFDFKLTDDNSETCKKKYENRSKYYNINFRNKIIKNIDNNNYKLIKLKSFMLEIINNFIKKIKPYIAIHVRRTDFDRLAKDRNFYTTDDKFKSFIDKFDKNMNIFIATDSKKTQLKFKKIYNDRLFTYCNSFSNSFRQTTLQDSIIDMFVCINSEHFKGTKRSTFSDFICKYRKYSL